MQTSVANHLCHSNYIVQVSYNKLQGRTLTVAYAPVVSPVRVSITRASANVDFERNLHWDSATFICL